MPRRAAYRCEWPHCPTIVGPARRFCRVHRQRSAQRKPRDDEAFKARGLRAWQRAREAFRVAYPLCCNPFGLPAHLVATAEVHHIVPLRAGGDLTDWNNLAPLCASCHRRISRMERAGEDVATMFEGWLSRYPGD